MNKLLYILLFMLMAATVSCHRTSEAEARLIAIDSLIPEAPDSALTLLEAIDTASLRGELRAYHALLTAQALYKAYIPAISDSLINRAWDYYKDHGSYDRRIRAMLYKGTTAEETGHPDTAMYWYKRTELESRTDDHYHRGYALMNMGKIFQENYVNLWSISYYRKAIEILQDSEHVTLKVFCSHNLGTVYRSINLDSAVLFLEYSKNTALKNQLVDDYYAALADLVACYNLQHQYSRALETAHLVFTNTKDTYVFAEATYFACEAACKLHLLDSARRMYSKLPAPISTRDSFMQEYALREIASIENNISLADSLKDIYNNQADILMYNKFRDILLDQVHSSEREYAQNTTTKKITVFFTTLLVLVIIILIFMIFIWFSRRRRIEAELKANQSDTTNRHIKKMLEHAKIENERIKKELYYYEMNDSTFKKQSFELQASLIGELLHSYNNTNNNSKDKMLKSEELIWTQMRKFSDSSSSNIITVIEQHFPSISERDKRIIIMYICGCSVDIISLALGYTNSKSVKNRLRILPKEVMNLNMTVQQLVEKFQSGNISFS